MRKIMGGPKMIRILFWGSIVFYAILLKVT